MLLEVGICVTGVDSTIGANVQERIQNMRDLRSGKIRRLVIAAIDTPANSMC